MKYFAAIATVPERVESLTLAVESLSPQARVQIYENDAWGALPGDCGKFHWLGKVDCDYYFTCDDDLIYPLNYCRRLAYYCDQYEGAYIVTLHGNQYYGIEQEKYYYGALRKYRCLDMVSEQAYVDVPGSGVSCIPRKYQKMIADAMPEIQYPNMADLYLAYALKQCGLKAIVAPHPAGWMKAIPYDGRTVFGDINERPDGDESPMVEMLNRVLE